MEKFLEESKKIVIDCSKAIEHYLQKIEDISSGKFPNDMLEKYQREIDDNIERICSIRNSLSPENQSRVAVMSAENQSRMAVMSAARAKSAQKA